MSSLELNILRIYTLKMLVSHYHKNLKKSLQEENALFPTCSSIVTVIEKVILSLNHQRRTILSSVVEKIVNDR